MLAYVIESIMEVALYGAAFALAAWLSKPVRRGVGRPMAHPRRHTCNKETRE